MSSLRDRLVAMRVGGVAAEEATISAIFDRMFIAWNDAKGARMGIHASSVLNDKDFCYREQIFTLFHKPKVSKLPVGLLRIFLEGWSVHQKWQDLLKVEGLATEIEKTRYHELYDLHFTPDAIVVINDVEYVLEIKSMNTFQFKNLRKCPPAAERQANLYMHCTGVHRAIILIDDKNSQEFKVYVVEYNEEVARPYTKRLSNIAKLRPYYRDLGMAPKRIPDCKNSSSKRAEKCPYGEICFAKKADRLAQREEWFGTDESCDTTRKPVELEQPAT